MLCYKGGILLRNGPTGKQYESHIKYSESGNPLTKFVNLCQSQEERRDKYGFCREFGIPWEMANRMRDWHWPKINLFIEAFTQGGCQLRFCGLASAAETSDIDN